MSADPVIVPAAASDAPALAALLREAELPHEDFAPHLGHFLLARDERGEVAGAIGAEVYGAEAWLRSFVVAPAAIAATEEFRELCPSATCHSRERRSA